MVYYQELLKDKESQNWFKASAALRIAQRGLQVFIDNGLRDVQKKILSIAKSIGCLSPDTNCTNCTIENLILCPTRGMCTTLNRCKFHNSPRKCFRNCPQLLCHLVRDQIIRYHRFSGPSWKNTKAEGWHADHWEIGKCYLPPDGYKDVSSSLESDFNALINVLINCTEFETKLSIDFTRSPNLLTEIREYGRNIRHSPDQKMKDIELNNLFQKLTSLLEDSVCLQTDSEAVSAVKNLKELQNDKLVIRVEDEQQILFEGLQMRLAKYYQRVFNSSLLCSLLPNRDSNPDKLFVTPKLIERDHRQIGKHDEHLMRLSVTSYSDIFFKGSTKCSNVYLIGEPGMGKTTLTIKCCLEWSAQHLREEGTLDELTNMSGNGHISFADADIFKDIDFVFRIALKDGCKTCQLVKMIKEQLLFKIYHDKDIKEAYDLLQTVLETKRCIIIADGLDEWSHPSDKDCSCSDEEKVVPFRNFANNAILLTTSRPWRLSQFRIKDSQIDKYLEIQGAVDPSSLVKKVVDCLNGETGTKTSVQFMEFVREKGVEKLLSIPIILMQLVCLWYEEFTVSNSICNIYASMISMLFGKIRVDNRQTKVLKQNFPGCIQCQCNIRTHGSLFMFLSHLALNTLFAQNMQSSNVFSINCVTAVLEEHSGDDLLERALESGLLTEERLDVANTSKFSFLHKTFQEFLAAVYVCMNEDLFSQTIKTHYMERNQEFIMDVSQVFIFICGLNTNLGEDMSKWISTFIPQQSMKACLYDNYEYERARPNENIVREIQGMVIEGYKEAISNNYVDTQITLNHFYFDDILLSAEQMGLLHKLLLMNKHRVKSIHVSACNDQLGQKNLQDVFISSKDSLTALTCWDHSGEYDLKMCKCFKYLSIWGDNLFKIELNVKNLLTCKVLKTRKSVEESLLNELSKNGKQLQTFIAYELKNVELFSNIFPQFRQLRYVCITHTDFEQFPFTPPDLISRITLKWVIISASALRDMLDRIATLPRNVHVVFKYCSIKPSSGFRRIRQLLDVPSNISIEHCERSATDVSFEVKSNG